MRDCVCAYARMNKLPLSEEREREREKASHTRRTARCDIDLALCARDRSRRSFQSNGT